MNRPPKVAVVGVPLAASLTGVAAAAAGWPGPDVVAAVACVGAGCAGLLFGTGETVRWPAAVRPERTSAGWHEARILAETLAAAASDSRARGDLVARIGAAVARHPAHPPIATTGGATRREYEQALSELLRCNR